MTTILLSYNEVQSLARKAANGAGLPHGVAEELGEAAVWLSARGVDAVRVVIDALADDGQGLQSILDGVAAIDTLCSGGAHGVPLQDRTCGLLMLGLAGVAATDTASFLAVDLGNGDVVPLSRVSDAGGPLPSAAVLRSMSGDGNVASDAFGAPRPAATDAAAYAAALALAAKTYVPASELSRIQGAGAGATDND